MKRLVVYTAVFAGRDPIRLPPADSDFDFFAFTESPQRDSEGVCDPRIVQTYPPITWDPVRSARMIKILPEKFLSGYRYSIWIDGSIALKTGKLDHLIDVYLSGDTPLASFRHQSRTNAYQEASVCLSARLDDPELIKRQSAAYRGCGLPEDTGLPEASFLLRDHSRLEEFSISWWNEVVIWSRRDQISFPFAAWKTGLKWARLEGLVDQNEYFTRMPHN